MKYGFIGCGNMGGALAAALAKATDGIILSDSGSGRAAKLAKELGVKSGTPAEAASCERVFLAVKPQDMAAVIASVADELHRAKPVVISMAAGITLAAIDGMIGESLPVIRIMPNTPVKVGCGVVLVSANGAVSAEVEADFLDDMKHAGTTDVIPEALMDAGCAVAGCGPAFAYMMIEALADGAVSCGLPRDKAVRYAAAMLAGSAEMVVETGTNPAALKDAVCSPGGSTIAGVRALEEAGFRAAVLDAVIASFERNRELGK